MTGKVVKTTVAFALCPQCSERVRVDLGEAVSQQAAEMDRLREALDWYASRAVDLARYNLHGKVDAMMAIMTELSLDAGAQQLAALEGK